MPLFGPPNVEKLKAKGDMNSLIRALNYHKDPAIPIEAARALGDFKDPKAISALATIVTSQSDPILREWAIDGLGKSRDPRGIDALLLTLQDSYSRMSTLAAGALRRLAQDGIRDMRAISPLVALLNDTNTDVQRYAAEALAVYGWQPERNLTGALYYISLNQWDQLVDIGEPAIEPLSKIIKEGKPKRISGQTPAHESALKALGKIGGEQAFEIVFELLKVNTEFTTLRLVGEHALVEIAKSTVEPLINHIAEPTLSDTIYEVLIEGLKQNGTHQAREALSAALKHKNPFVQKAASYALSELGDVRAIPVLLDILDTANVKEQGRTLTALGDLGAVEVIPRLIEVLSKGYDAEFYGPLEQAASALEKLGWKPEQDEIGVIFYVTLNQLDKCAEMGTPAIAPLIALLKTSSKAAEALEKMGAPAVEPLCAALKKEVLASAGFKPKKLPQGASLASENWYYKSVGYRQAIITLLGNIGDTKAVETLTWVSHIDHYVVNELEYEEIAAQKLNWPVREAAKEALAKIAPK